VQASAHQIIDVIPMRHGFVPCGTESLPTRRSLLQPSSF
jgi:hypothetical protein